MSYHPLVNGTYQQKNPQSHFPINTNSPLIQKSRQKHVTFRQQNYPQNSASKPQNSSSKPKYHFTYGYPYQVASFNPKTFDTLFAPQQFQVPPQNNPYRNIETQIYQNLSNNLFKGRSPSSKKRKLKIFPQKYDKLNQPKTSQKSHEFKEIGQLKGAIQRLRQEITNLTLDFSKNTSRQFADSVYKNQADRTKRLSELNEFNQKLYSQLAMKLKLISLEEYENALQIQNSNVKFLESVYSSATKEKPRNQTFDIEKGQDHLKFMDIQEFERSYQEKLSLAENSPNRTLNLEKNVQNSKIELDSPFLVRENKLEAQIFKTIQADPSRRKEKHDHFTFHKNVTPHQSHFGKQKQQAAVQNEVVQKVQKNTKEFRPNKQNALNQAKTSHRKPFEFETQTKEKRQIHDMNREIQNKIMRKRSASEYAYLAKIRKY